MTRRGHVRNGAIVILAALFVGGPALFTHNGFISDFTNHLWLVWVQQTAISHHVMPTYFISAPQVGVFYPVFEFYGGTLYAVTGGVAALLNGHVTIAYVATMLLSVAAAYGGLLWLARQLGARSWLAHAPALAFVSSAYYVTNLYGRGAWPEFVATSSIPVLVASGLRLARARRVDLFPAALFVLSAIVFTGSHNVTLLLGALFLGLGAVCLSLALRLRPSDISIRRALAISGLFALAVGINAWFLAPNLLHAGDITIAHQGVYRWSATRLFNTPGVLFNPLRSVPKGSSSPALYVQAPDWFLAWFLIVAVALWTQTGVRLRRAGLTIAGLLLVLLALILIGPLWDGLPHILREVQFPFRLNTYVALCAAGLVMVAVLALEQSGGTRRRAATAGLAAVVAVSVGLCAWQLWEVKVDAWFSYRNRSAVFVSTHKTPLTWSDEGYSDASAPIVRTRGRSLSINPASITSDHVSLWVRPPAGTGPIATNIAGGAYAVTISGGLLRIGRTRSGHAVVRRRHDGSGPVFVSLSLNEGSVVFGQVVSAVSLLVALGLLIVGGRRRWRARSVAASR